MKTIIKKHFIHLRYVTRQKNPNKNQLKNTISLKFKKKKSFLI